MLWNRLKAQNIGPKDGQNSKNTHFGTLSAVFSKTVRQICFSLCCGPLIVTFVEPITFDALELLESPKSWPERQKKRQKHALWIFVGRFHQIF
jgi:hypothetical protein